MIYRKHLETREEWLKARRERIGGSDTAALLGMSPWKTPLDLYLEKTGEKESDDLSNNEAVAFGNTCEPLIRDYFEVNHPDLFLEYEPNNIWYNDKYPFAAASLDGWLTDQRGKMGIFEAKTSTIRNRKQLSQWEGQIPQHYYTQVIWYMAVTEADFVWLSALIRTAPDVTEIRDYHIERKDCEQDIRFLMEAGAEFWDCVVNHRMPVVHLPKI